MRNADDRDRGREFQAAVVTSERSPVARGPNRLPGLLDVSRLLDRFDVMVCAGDYKKSKPDPEAFLMAAARLAVAPKGCLVFEDTATGIAAATAAGMQSVLVPPPRRE